MDQLLDAAKTSNLIAIAAILAAILLILQATRSGRIKLIPRPLMTRIERETLGYLEAAVPSCRVHAQVSMGALLTPERGLSPSERLRWHNRYAQKRVDYVLEDRSTGKVVALVELDDRTHDVERDRQRDALTAAAGYMTVRLPAFERPTLQNVARRVTAALEARAAAQNTAPKKPEPRAPRGRPGRAETRGSNPQPEERTMGNWDFDDAGSFANADDANRWAERNGIDARDVHTRNDGENVKLSIRRSALGDRRSDDDLGDGRRRGF